MGKFDGMLLASDFDGTLYYNGNISEENLKAIKYFQDNGGKFTVCSGRYYEFLKQFSSQFTINTYTICYNGAFIVDSEKNEVLHEGFCDCYIFEIINHLIEKRLPYSFIAFYTTDEKEPINFAISEYLSRVDELKKKSIYKVLLRTDTAENAEIGVKAANEFDLRDYIAVRSWDKSLEILKRENAKGKAVRRVAQKIGARLVVAVGDYENDIEMLKAADLSYAVDNAIDSVKKFADRVTAHAKDSAIAKIIYELEQNI